MGISTTLVHKLLDHTDKRPDKPAVRYFKNDDLYTLTWQQTYDHIDHVYRSLKGLGLNAGDTVAIYSDTCKEWGFLDLALMGLGSVSVPIYHSSPVSDVQVILNKAKPQYLFVQNEALYNRIKNIPELCDIKKIIFIDAFKHNNEKALTLQDVLNLKVEPASLQDAVNTIDAKAIVTVIFTSGTSGQPKGVVLTHEQVLSSVSETFPLLGVTDQDSTLTFLPFTHVLGRIELWGHYFCGYCLGYAQSIDRIKKNLTVVQPTVIVGVPRIFEKIYFGILSQIEISKIKKRVFDYAIKTGGKLNEYRQKKEGAPFVLGLQALLSHHLVYKNIQQKLGGRIRFAVSGGAPLDPQISDFFQNCGLTLLEGYGLTETTGPIFVNTLFDHRSGTVGKAIGDVKVKFAEDGEILVHSLKITPQYYEDVESTTNAFDEEGFFRTGDIGGLDKDGFLKITDRKKDLIKTAGGKFVAPQKLQNLFATQAMVSHVHIHGDKRKFIVALITLDPQELKKFRIQNEMEDMSLSELYKSRKLNEEIRKIVSQINSQLASFETIKNFLLLEKDFSIEGGELTPSLKMKRKKIDELYAKQIEELYQ